MKRKFCLKFICLLIISFIGIQSVFASENVYKLSYGTDLFLLGGGIATQFGSYFLGKYQKPLTSNDVQSLSRSDVNRFDRSATYNLSDTSNRWSNFTVVALMASPAILMLNQELRSDFFVISTMFAETLIIQSGLAGISKSLTGRKRPFVYNPDVPMDQKLGKSAVQSFYSGHTSAAFSSAVFLSTVFSGYYPESPMRYFVWGSSLMLASATGYMRYRAGKHSPSDILAGAAIGGAIGFMIPALHKNKDRKWNIFPDIGPSYTGVTFSYKF